MYKYTKKIKSERNGESERKRQLSKTNKDDETRKTQNTNHQSE